MKRVKIIRGKAARARSAAAGLENGANVERLYQVVSLISQISRTSLIFFPFSYNRAGVRLKKDSGVYYSIRPRTGWDMKRKIQGVLVHSVGAFFRKNRELGVRSKSVWKRRNGGGNGQVRAERKRRPSKCKHDKINKERGDRGTEAQGERDNSRYRDDTIERSRGRGFFSIVLRSRAEWSRTFDRCPMPARTDLCMGYKLGF